MAQIDENGNVIEEQQQGTEGTEQGQQGGEQQQIPLSEDKTPSSVDKSLDAFIRDSTRGPVGKTTQSETTPKLGPDGKPIPAQGQQQGQQPNANRQGTQQNQPIRTVPQGTAEVRQFGPNYFRNAQSDIVDRRTGKVIAKAGIGYAAFSAIYPDLAKSEAALEKANTTIAAIEKSQQVAISAGLTIEEAAMGTRIMAAYKKDAAATIKYLLNEAQTSGKDVSSVVQGGGFDPSVMRSTMQEMLTEIVKPFQFLLQDREQQIQHQQGMEEARNTVNEFTQQFPDSIVQDKEIGAIMQAQGLTIKEAYFALKAHSFENKYDWTKPLGPQIAARRQQQGGGTQPAPNGGGANRRLPDMSGRGGSNQNVRTDTRTAGVEEGYGDIIKGVFTDLGLNADG